MFQRILVPLDGSSLAEQALPVAARLARATHGSLLLLRIVSTLSEYGMYITEPSLLMQEAIEEDLTRATAYLAQKAQLPALAGIETRVAVFSGSSAEYILDVAQRQQMDMIVMCSHGETGLRRWALGSVAQKVARHSLVPTLVLNAKDTSSSGIFSEDAHSLRALVTLDGSSEAEAVVKPIAHLVSALSAPSQGKLHLLRVVNLPEYDGRWKRLSSTNFHFIDRLLNDAEVYLSSVRERVRALSKTCQLTITTSVQTNADIAEAILKTAEDQEVTTENKEDRYDLIAMTTHGHSGVARWAMGSVTERVLGATTLPLFIFRSKIP